MQFQIFTYMFRPKTGNINESRSKTEDRDESRPMTRDRDESYRNFAHRREILTEILLSYISRIVKRDARFRYAYDIHHAFGQVFFFDIVYRPLGEVQVSHFFVIFDNRSGIQRIGIARPNGEASSEKLCKEIEKDLRGILDRYNLDIDIRPEYNEESFWSLCRSKQDLGIEYVQFHFPYPNLARISEMVGEYFNNIARETNSEPTLKLKGQGGENLMINEENEFLQSANGACSKCGTKIEVKPKGEARIVVGVDSPVYVYINSEMLNPSVIKEYYREEGKGFLDFLPQERPYKD